MRVRFISKQSGVAARINFSSRVLVLPAKERFSFKVYVFSIVFNPFAPGDFAEKRILKLVEWFSGHCHAIKS